eukprot:4172925-Amphidinium_carterae.1
MVPSPDQVTLAAAAVDSAPVRTPMAVQPMVPNPDSDQVMLADLSPVHLESEQGMSDAEPLTPLTHAAAHAAMPKAMAKPMPRQLHFEERSAPLGLTYTTRDHKIMWYKRTDSIAIWSRHGARRQLGSTKPLCSKEQAYRVALDTIAMLEGDLLQPHEVSQHLFVWTR